MKQNLNLRFCWTIAMTDHPCRYSYSPDCKVSARQICDQVEKRKVAPVCTDVSVVFFENQKHNFTHENACHLFRTIVDSAAIPRRRLVRRSPRNIVIRCVREWLCKPPGIILATVLNSLFPGGSQGAGGDLRQAADTCFVVERLEMNHTMMLLDNIRWRNISWRIWRHVFESSGKYRMM